MRTAALAIACLLALSWLPLHPAAWAQTAKPADGQGTTKAPQGSVAPSTTTMKPGVSVPPDRAQRGTTMAPLTEAECHGLGGQTGSVDRCPSGRVCIRADQDGVIHQACITASK